MKRIWHEVGKLKAAERGLLICQVQRSPCRAKKDCAKPCLLLFPAVDNFCAHPDFTIVSMSFEHAEH